MKGASIMACCPCCGKNLKLTDWKQNCPYCGTNIPAFGFQEKLMKQADVAEVQHYHFQKKLDRVKNSFIGSKLAIVRIITSIIPAGPLFLPLAKLKITGGLEPFDGNFSALTLIKKIDSLTDFDALLSFIKGDKAALCAVIALLLLALSLLVTLTHLVLLMLSCSPKGKKRNLFQCILILVFTSASMILTFLVRGETAFAVPSFGAWLYLLLQIVNFVIDYLTFKQGIEITHKQCYVGGIPIEEYFEMIEKSTPLEEIRAEQYKRLKQRREEKQQKIREEKEKEALNNG